MGADQKIKRVNDSSSSLVGCTYRDQNVRKRKRIEPLQNNIKMRPNISLEWDSKTKSVVSKREQIGISRRHMIPFIELGPHSHDILADVISVPREIFEFKNLSEILSYGVWQNQCSEKERSSLSQFLPRGVDPDIVVRDLLTGSNFHFGNPFLNWGTSLCSGELHPDNVLQEEQSLKACKKGYHLDLQKYQNEMIENLQTWKEKWASCNDSEVDIVQKMWRSRKHAKRSLPPPETRVHDTEVNHVATPESCSYANSEKAYSSDNQDTGIMQGESQKRKWFLNKQSDSSSSGLKVVAIPKQAAKVHKRNIQREDGAKYMSYIKVSKEQHERVKSSMKHTGNSIQPKSLNSVLGSIDALNVQPFERFEAEERKNLHDYWLKLSNEDIPKHFAAWKNRQLQRQQVTLSLGEEIKEKVTEEKDKEESWDNLREPSDDSEVEIVELDKEQPDDLLLKEQTDDEETIHEMTTTIENEKETKVDYVFEEEMHYESEIIEDDVSEHVFVPDSNQQQIASLNDSSPRVSAVMIEPPKPVVFLRDQYQPQIPSLISNNNNNPPQVVNSMEMQLHRNCESAKTAPVVSLSSLPSDVWQAACEVHSSYYQSSAANVGYASSTQGLSSLGHPQFIQEQQSFQILDMEPNRIDKDHLHLRGKDMLLQRRESSSSSSSHDHNMSFFNSYPNNQDQNELLQSLLLQKQQPRGLHFQPGNDVMMMQVDQFPPHSPRHLKSSQVVHPSLPLEMRNKRLNDIYLQQQHHHQNNNVQEHSIMYSMPRQEQLPANIHDWVTTVNAADVRMAGPTQPQLIQNNNNDNWYDNNMVNIVQNSCRDGWPPTFDGGAVGVGSHSHSHSHSHTHSHSLTRGSSNSVSDQTLFSVLSECNELRPGTSYDSIASIQAGNFSGGIGVGISIPSSASMLQQQINPLNCLSGGHEPPPPLPTGAGGGLKMNNNLVGWMGMGLPQQNPGIHDSIPKPFLRSWNQ